MTKKQIRESVRNKFNGRCAYCGSELIKGWHTDHIEPIRRLQTAFKDQWGKKTFYVSGSMHPELETIDNLNPACASCNINKHNQTLEEFRSMIKKFVNSLNEYSVQYKIAKKYGLIIETSNEVVFFFETATARRLQEAQQSQQSESKL